MRMEKEKDNEKSKLSGKKSRRERKLLKVAKFKNCPNEQLKSHAAVKFQDIIILIYIICDEGEIVGKLGNHAFQPLLSDI